MVWLPVGIFYFKVVRPTSDKFLNRNKGMTIQILLWPT